MAVLFASSVEATARCDESTGAPFAKGASLPVVSVEVLSVQDNDYKHAAAVGWGGLPASTAQYLPAITGQGSTACQTWTVPNPDLDYETRGGYWSITTYSAQGWIETDEFYLSGEKMQDNGDDTSTAYFNCPDVASSLKVTEGWTAVVRFYEPVDVQENLKYLEKLGTISLKTIE